MPDQAQKTRPTLPGPGGGGDGPSSPKVDKPHVEDLLKRTLALSGFTVRHVMNITDVGHLVSQADEGEDKMEVGAAREGKTAWEIAKLYTDARRPIGIPCRRPAATAPCAERPGR